MAAKGYNRGVTERGNKDKERAYAYLRPDLHKNFKITCFMEGFSMSDAIEVMVAEMLKKGDLFKLVLKQLKERGRGR